MYIFIFFKFLLVEKYAFYKVIFLTHMFSLKKQDQLNKWQFYKILFFFAKQYVVWHKDTTFLAHFQNVLHA